jgi:hypothetical protein
MAWAEMVQPHDFSNHRRVLNISQFNPAFCGTNPGGKGRPHKAEFKSAWTLAFSPFISLWCSNKKNNKFTPAVHFWTMLWPVMLTLKT